MLPVSVLSCRTEFPMVLVANKVDLESDRAVSASEGEDLAQSLKVRGHVAQ